MAKKKASKNRNKPPLGARVRVKPDVHSPDFPEIAFGGWTGTLVEYAGSKSKPKLMIEWDESTIANMPASYREQCEQNQLLYQMACLSGDDVEVLD